MVLCGICAAEDHPKKVDRKLEVEVEVIPDGDLNPMADGETSASEMSAFFDGIFGNLGRWLAHTFSDNRPLEAGNTISSEVFMSGERAAYVGNSSSDGKIASGGTGPVTKPNKPLIDVDASWPNGAPRIESKSSRHGGSKAERFIDGQPVRRSKAEIDAYFRANVVHTRKVNPKASAASETQRVEVSAQAVSPATSPKAISATLAIQTIPEPSSVLLCGLATMAVALRRRR